MIRFFQQKFILASEKNHLDARAFQYSEDYRVFDGDPPRIPLNKGDFEYDAVGTRHQ
jgi:hypothetical protein